MSRSIPFLDLPAQYRRLKPQIDAQFERVFESCQFVLGPSVQDFEEKLAHYCGVSDCVAVSSGTQALHLIMLAEGIGPGDAVFLPSFTYVATAEVVLALGARPVFVDVDARTFQIDPTSLVQRIKTVRRDGELRPRALIGVDLFGQAAPWESLREIAKKEDLFLLADDAQSLGATYKGRRLGAQASAAALSFYPTKPLGAYGDSGAILTSDSKRASLYRSLRSHGQGAHRYEIQHIGLNARMDSLQAAVLLAKWPSFSQELERRQKIAQLYDKALDGYVKIPKNVEHCEGSWSVYAILLANREERESVKRRLEAENIGCAIYYPLPLHQQPAYKAFHDGQSLPISQNLAQCILALPIYPDLGDEDVGRIAQIIKDQTTGFE